MDITSFFETRPQGSDSVSALAITIGAGANRPQGTRQTLEADLSVPQALHQALTHLSNGDESWWSPHTFKAGTTPDRNGVPTERPEDYRHGDLWESSIAAVTDADRIGHAAWDAASREALMSAIRSGKLPGSSAHPTPHGARIAFPLDVPATDRDAWRRAAAGACRLVQDALAKLPELGLEVDTGASCDLARCFYAPHAIVDGAARDDQVFLLRDRTWTLQELATLAPATSAEPKQAEPVADEILPNDRHETLMRLAASLRNKGLDADEIYAALQKVNERRCKPPKPDAEIRALADYFDKKDAAKHLTQQEFNRTDLGNAQRLVVRHGQDLRYCHPLKTWLVWDGKRWKRDQSAEVMRRAKETIRNLYFEAPLLPDAERAQLVKHALASEKEDRLRAMVNLAASESGITVLPEDLDSDPWLLCVKNGTLDLRTGTLRPHAREDLITKLAPVDYDPDATCPVLESFLARMVPDPEDRSFLQRGTGYTLTGDTSEEVLLFIHGPTNSGKSTFTEAVKATMGDYAVTADFEAFLRRREPGIRNDIARMAGARMVLSLEVEEGRRLAVATIKSLTGGDTVTARFLHKEFFEFRPAFKPWLVANHKPAANASDSAFWRRILVVPFTTEIPKSERNPRVKKTLRDSPASRSALLAWAVKGCLAWQREGLRPPARVVQATETYRAECDTVQQFIAARCIKSPGLRTAFEDLYASYKDCCELNDDIPISDKAFGKELTKSGIASKRGTGGRRERLGIGLSDRSDASDLWSDKSSLESSCSEKGDGESLRSLESLDGEDPAAAEERAAIQEYDGGVAREEAETRA